MKASPLVFSSVFDVGSDPHVLEGDQAHVPMQSRRAEPATERSAGATTMRLALGSI